MARLSAASMTLVKELEELDMTRWPTGAVAIDIDPAMPLIMGVKITPTTGRWQGREYSFHVEFADNFPHVPPHAWCHTQIWHPNITTAGVVCNQVFHLPPAGIWNPTLNGPQEAIEGLWVNLAEANEADPNNPEAAASITAGTYDAEVDESLRTGSIRRTHAGNAYTGFGQIGSSQGRCARVALCRSSAARSIPHACAALARLGVHTHHTHSSLSPPVHTPHHTTPHHRPSRRRHRDSREERAVRWANRLLDEKWSRCVAKAAAGGGSGRRRRWRFEEESRPRTRARPRAWEEVNAMSHTSEAAVGAKWGERYYRLRASVP
tara:strand:- start:687 stop:1649 length:963 start_codon:yes stop_codon:yes gene_type:complete